VLHKCHTAGRKRTLSVTQVSHSRNRTGSRSSGCRQDMSAIYAADGREKAVQAALGGRALALAITTPLVVGSSLLVLSGRLSFPRRLRPSLSLVSVSDFHTETWDIPQKRTFTLWTLTPQLNVGVRVTLKNGHHTLFAVHATNGSSHFRVDEFSRTVA
jgi:hypothetical protein